MTIVSVTVADTLPFREGLMNTYARIHPLDMIVNPYHILVISRVFAPRVSLITLVPSANIYHATAHWPSIRSHPYVSSPLSTVVHE